MTSFLKKMFGCCITEQQTDESSNSAAYLNDIIYIAVPRNEFSAYFAHEPQDRNLDLSSFMALYKYATEDLVSNPGLGYVYVEFVFLVDREYIRVEGWVPIPKLDLSWCHLDESRTSATNVVSVFGKSFEDGPRPRDIICVDICRKVSTAEMLLGNKEENIYTGKALLLPKSQRGRLFTYSRHMNASLNCRGEIADSFRKLGYKCNK